MVLTTSSLKPIIRPVGAYVMFVIFTLMGANNLMKTGPMIEKRNLDTGEESEVVKIKGLNYDLSPDGREVVFQVDGAVKTVSLNGGEPREVYHGSAANSRWTSDGRYIIVRASGNTWRVPAQGGTPLKLDLSVPKMQFFTLHPDNSRFAFSVNEESKSELWVLENFLPPLKVAK